MGESAAREHAVGRRRQPSVGLRKGWYAEVQSHSDGAGYAGLGEPACFPRCPRDGDGACAGAPGPAAPAPPSRSVRRHHGEAPTGPAVFGQHRLEGLLLALGPRPRHVGVWAGGRAWGILGLGSAPRRRAEPEPALPCRVPAPFGASSFSPAKEQLLSQCADRETEAQRGNRT